MKKVKFTIESNVCIALDTYRMVLSSDGPSGAGEGEFVDIAIEGLYLRRPISVCDYEGNSMTLVYKVVGEGSRRMSLMTSGQQLEILTGLGKGFDTAACRKKALLVAGGLGSAPLLRVAKELLAEGKEVTVILGYNRAEDVVLVEDFRKSGIEPVVVTVDGSVGLKGFPTTAIEQLKPEFDFFYCCGPMVMMKAVCNAIDAPGEASLEERMGCGAGFCYGCSIQTTKGPRRVCKDGPVFRKEEIIW